MKMDSIIIKLRGCPFCRCEQAVVLSDKQFDFPMAQVEADYRPGRPFVQFCSHTVAHDPCVHLVHLELECRQRDADRVGLDDSAEYDNYTFRHAVLKAADPDHELVGLLRWVLSEPQDEIDHPDTPFRFVLSDVEGSVHYSHGHELNGGKRGKWWATADALYAADVAQFICECEAMNDSLSLHEASE